MPRASACRRAVLLGAAALPLAGFSVGRWLAPAAELWPRWTAHDPASRRRVAHDALSALLARYRRVGADGIARFAYGAVAAADRAGLERYLERLAGTPVGSLARAEQLGFWINLYNALTLRLVLAHYPVDSIRDIDISPGLFADGPWGAALTEIEGVALSLNDIEHRILRPIWRDARIHYVVNCAALGCPDLPAEALAADRRDRQLEAAARGFVNHPRGCRLERGRLLVSSLYVWYREDFGADEAAVAAHLRRHAAPPLAAALAALRSIDGHGYDWALNDAG